MSTLSKDLPSTPALLGPLIARVKQKMRKRINLQLKPYGITAEQRAILLLLCDEGVMTQVQLCDRMSIEPSNLSTTLKRLVTKGYVEKRDHPDEPRAYLVHVTEKTKEIASELRTLSAPIDRDLFRGIDEEEQKMLLEILTKMDANL